MRSQDLHFIGIVREGRADLLTFEFLMLVTTNRQRGTDRIKARQVVAAEAEARAVLSGRRLEKTLLDDRDAQLGIVVAVAATDIPVRASPGEANTAEATARLRVVDLAHRRIHIAGSATAAARMKRKLPIADPDVCRRARFCGGRTHIDGRIPCRTVERGLRNVLRNHVDETTNGVRPIEQGGGAS